MADNTCWVFGCKTETTTLGNLEMPSNVLLLGV